MGLHSWCDRIEACILHLVMVSEGDLLGLHKERQTGSRDKYEDAERERERR